MNTIMKHELTERCYGWVLALSVTLTGCGREEPANPLKTPLKQKRPFAALRKS